MSKIKSFIDAIIAALLYCLSIENTSFAGRTKKKENKGNSPQQYFIYFYVAVRTKRYHVSHIFMELLIPFDCGLCRHTWYKTQTAWRKCDTKSLHVQMWTPHVQRGTRRYRSYKSICGLIGRIHYWSIWYSMCYHPQWDASSYIAACTS